jgi:hypothetical protein
MQVAKQKQNIIATKNKKKKNGALIFGVGVDLLIKNGETCFIKKERGWNCKHLEGSIQAA